MSNEFDWILRPEGVLRLTTTGAPAVEPIGPDDVKAHCRIDIDDDNILIQQKILAVRLTAERQNNLAFITQTWTYALKLFPLWALEIPIRPIQSITKVEYLLNGSLTTLSTNNYLTDLNFRPPRIMPKPGLSWPSLADIRPGNVVITFKAGYGDTAISVPWDVKMYLLTKVADAYENRESYTTTAKTPVDFVENLIAQERLY
jgi:uncharacterized phiE125 gp8 family phage protein